MIFHSSINLNAGFSVVKFEKLLLRWVYTIIDIVARHCVHVWIDISFDKITCVQEIDLYST